MTIPNLVSVFQELQRTGTSQLDQNTFSALSIPGVDGHRLAIASDNAPCVLFATINEGVTRTPLPIILEAIGVQHNIECRVLNSDGNYEKGRFTIVRCLSRDSLLQHYFLRVASAIIATLRKKTKQDEISQAIRKLVELFSVLSEPERKSVSGLWGELFLISQSSEPDQLLSAWHAKPEDIHDFAADGQRVEVKTASNKARCHHFNLDQLVAHNGIKIVIASLFVEPDSLGVSLGDIIEIIRGHMKKRPQLITHLDRVVTQTLGAGLRRALGQSFDYRLAKDSLLYFESDQIPSVSYNLPSSVFDVHFKSELDTHKRADLKKLRREGGIIRAMLAKE